MVIMVNKKNKIKTIVVLFVAILFACLSVSAAEKDIELVNGLKYHKSMLAGLRPVELMRIPLGKKLSSVGGSEEDPENFTEGVPFAFRATADGAVWILDSANKKLKLFAKNGRLKNVVSLSNMGTIVRDFAFAANNCFWLLNSIEGFIYHIDSDGKILSQIEGFADAIRIESASNDELLVDMPMLGSVMRFGTDQTLKERYGYDEGLSLIEGIGNKVLGLSMEERNVKLMMRTVASPAQNITLAEFPLDIDNPKVSYAGAEIIGKDSNGNIYLNLIACHEEGPIFRDRLYRCSQIGKPNSFVDIITIPCLTPDLPRSKIVTPEGKIVFFYLEKNYYVLAMYTIPGA